MELDFVAFGSNEQFKSHVSDYDSLENMKEYMYKEMGIDMKK